MKTKLLLLLAVCVTAFSANAFTVVSITGEAQGGWGDGHDFDMTSTDGVHWVCSGLNTTAAAVGGGLKFRADHSWAIPTQIWGAADFPSGTALSPGNNIVCTAGTWDVTFNSTSGEYLFTAAVPPPTCKLVGSAVTGGSITMNPTTPGKYTLPLTTFLTGTAQIEYAGVLQVGGNGFPVGDITSGTAINILAGAYTSVTYDNSDSSYIFTAAPLYPRIGIIGSGTTGTDAGWSQDIAMATNDGIKYQLSQQLYSINTSNGGVGEVKFRQDQNWNIPSFGGTTFTATNNVGSNNNIPVTADGVYNLFFNLDTKVYNFVKPGSVALIGAAVGGWDNSAGNPGPVDVNQMTTSDNETFTFTGIVVSEGELLFRQDNKWDVKFGGTSFPTGPSAPGDSGNIIVGAGQAGIYDVTLVKSTGAYTFTPNLATTSFASAGFKVSPNPSNNVWNFTSSKEAIVSVQVIDMLGKVVATSTSSTVDASALNTGVYFAKVATANATETVKVVRN